MNETIRLLMERKSMRAYEKQDIPQEDVQAILEAAAKVAAEVPLDDAAGAPLTRDSEAAGAP